MALKMHPSLAVHPGRWLREELMEPNAVTIHRLASAFKVSRQALSSLLNGRAALSADMAIRFEKAFGINAETLMRMQVAHDMAQARAHEREIAVERVLEPA
jgi:antitoxin HigA-1